VIHPLLFFWLLLKASLLSTGGLSNLPIAYDDLLSRGLATERQFAEALAVSKISPGPSGLWPISLGYLVGGLPGALLALVAISLPPMLVLPVDRLHRLIGQHPLVQGFVRGLGLAVSGIFVVILAEMMLDTGIDVVSMSIMLASVWLGTLRQVPFIALLALAGLIGIVVY
jgi:chromate transporter